MAPTATDGRKLSDWPRCLGNSLKQSLGPLLLGLLVIAPIRLENVQAQDAAQSNNEAKVPPSPQNPKTVPATDPKSTLKPKPAEAKPKTEAELVPAPPAEKPASAGNQAAGNAANAAAANAAQAPPSNFGRLDAGQGQLLARTSVPGFFGDFFAPGGNILNVPGTPLHDTPQTPNATPLALGFASISNPGTAPPIAKPAQLYFRSVTTATGVAGVPFYYAPNTQDAAGDQISVFKTKTPGINPATPKSNATYQLDTIPPNSHMPIGYFVRIPSTEVRVDGAFTGQLGDLRKAPAANAVHPLNDVIAVGTPITVFGTNQAAVTKVYGIFPDTTGTNNAVPLVFSGGAGVATQIPILFVLTSNTSTSVYSPSAAAGGAQKLVDNASPLPRDRVFFNYSYFENTAIIVNGHEVDINRLTPGFEKTFLNQQASVEVRVPFATTIDNVNLTGTTNTGNIMLGNQTTYLKALLYSDSNIAFSGGLGIQLPTAASTEYSVNGYKIAAGTGKYTQLGPLDVLKIRNEAVHLMPFLGTVYTPNDKFYAQSVAQLDFATNGNTVYNAAVYPMLNSSDKDHPENWMVTSATSGLSKAGSLNDTNFMYLSANVGYWMYKTKNLNEKGFTGFSPTAELHYNQSLTRGDTVSGFYGNAGNGVGNISQVNGVLGANTVIGFDKYLSVAYVAPFGTGVNRAFDGELRVMFNYYFGASRVNPRFSNVPGQ